MNSKKFIFEALRILNNALLLTVCLKYIFKKETSKTDKNKIKIICFNIFFNLLSFLYSFESVKLINYILAQSYLES